MATLDQAFIKAYTQARQTPASTIAEGAGVVPLVHPRRVGSGALGMRSIGLIPRKLRAAEPAPAPPTAGTAVANPAAIEQAAPVAQQPAAEQIVARAVTLMVERAIAPATEPLVLPTVERFVEQVIAPPVLESIAAPTAIPAAIQVETPVAEVPAPEVADCAANMAGEAIAGAAIEPIAEAPEAVAALPHSITTEPTIAKSSMAREVARDFMPSGEDSEPFALSLATPLAPELILAESLVVEQTVYYCEPAEAMLAPDQSDLLVWHPTTRDFIMSESELVVVPRFSPRMQATSAAPTTAATLEERRSVDREVVADESMRSETCEAHAEAPTNRAVVVPPPLPKTLIPPAPETLSDRLGEAGEASGETVNVAVVAAAPTVDAAAVDAAIAEAAAIEISAIEAATIAAAIGKPAFAPLSTFSPRLVGEVLRPQLEVDRFAWPEVCGLLLGRVEADFIRLAVELTVRLNGANQVVAWTGCQRGEGRTTSLLCMAQRLSALGQHCVLVDADFSRPELARRLGISAQVGWEEIVAGDAQLSDVLIGSIEDKIALLPRRQKCAAGTHPGGGPRAAALFGMLREAFDVVLLDVGPMAGDAELADMASCAAAANVGGAYLVFDSRNTTTADMAATAESLRGGGIKVWGAIENFRH